MSSPAAERRCVWLGSAGTGTAFGLAQTLREHWGRAENAVRIVAADIRESHLVATALLADEFRQVPLTADAGFADILIAGLREVGATHYQPILDEEILLGATLRSQQLLGELVVFAPPIRGARLCLDKLEGARWMDEVGIPTPPTVPVGEATWNGVPLFAKPRHGRGSVGARPIDDERTLEGLKVGEDAADLIVQPRCEGPELTIDAVHLGGVTRAVVRERLEVKAGVCTKARVFEDEGLEALAHLLALGLGIEHAFCFQVMRRGGQWVVTDLNARPGAGTRLTVAAGVDVLGAMFAYHFGEPFEHFLGRLPHERFVVRQYAEYVTR
jgi:hypothetical protein